MLEETLPDDAQSIRLRPVAPEDEAFLLAVYSSTRQEEMALVPWDEAQREAFLRMQFTAQQQHYQSYYPEAVHEIIERDGQAIGRLYVSKTAEEIHILDLTVLPDYRGAGVGSQLLGDLIGEADAVDKPLSIYVESFSPSLRLFERLGFQKVEENGVYFLLKRSSSSSRRTAGEG